MALFYIEDDQGVFAENNNAIELIDSLIDWFRDNDIYDEEHNSACVADLERYKGRFTEMLEHSIESNDSEVFNVSGFIFKSLFIDEGDTLEVTFTHGNTISKGEFKVQDYPTSCFSILNRFDTPLLSGRFDIDLIDNIDVLFWLGEFLQAAIEINENVLNEYQYDFKLKS
ncbi:MAG: hypothetical protein CMK64_05025 [Pseudoalteromonas sp.]|nr:hypothetical protein [Pseudoalteromonas sp.]|tara:strand:- start:14958 stop:15467 length:510 start_codon:yes stop_codon:yes gene_type:complete